MPLAPELLRQPGQPRHVPLDLRRRDERAPAAAPGAHDHAAALERVEGLPQGHATHADALRQLALRRKTVAGSELPRRDRLRQPVLDLGVRGYPVPLEAAKDPTQ